MCTRLKKLSIFNILESPGKDLYSSCVATAVSMKNPTMVTKIEGIHRKPRTNANVTAFLINDPRKKGLKTLSTIPNGIEKFFPQIQIFWWVVGNISTIDSTTFKPWPHLIIINLDYNKLTTLDGNLFQHTRKLRRIYFTSNLLQHVGLDLLTGLTKLERLGFSRNPCINNWAKNPQEIQEINRQLRTNCPPLKLTSTHVQEPQQSRQLPDQ